MIPHKKVLVEVIRGSRGDPIGVVRESEDPQAPPGMVVLFSSPPSVGEKVYLGRYVVRPSKKSPGRHYVKAFSWASDPREAARRAHAREIANVQAVAAELGVELRPEPVLELALTTDAGALAAVLHRATGKTVLASPYDVFILLNGRRGILVSRDFSWFEPKILPFSALFDEIHSDEHGMVVLDDAFDAFEAAELARILVDRGTPALYTSPESGTLADVTVILPKSSKTLEKLLLTKKHQIPPGTKGMIYLEILGVRPEEISFSPFKGV